MPPPRPPPPEWPAGGPQGAPRPRQSPGCCPFSSPRRPPAPPHATPLHAPPRPRTPPHLLSHLGGGGPRGAEGWMTRHRSTLILNFGAANDRTHFRKGPHWNSDSIHGIRAVAFGEGTKAYGAAASRLSSKTARVGLGPPGVGLSPVESTLEARGRAVGGLGAGCTGWGPSLAALGTWPWAVDRAAGPHAGEDSGTGPFPGREDQTHSHTGRARPAAGDAVRPRRHGSSASASTDGRRGTQRGCR